MPELSNSPINVALLHLSDTNWCRVEILIVIETCNN